jgi:hypothetical protein
VSLNRRSSLTWVLGIFAPWLWFWVRDLGLFGLFDVIAILFPALTAGTVGGLLLVAVRTRRWRWVLPAVSAVGVGVLSIMSPWRAQIQPAPSSPATAVTIVFANLLLSNVDSQVVDVIAAYDADVVITAETNGTQYLRLSEWFGPPVVSAGDEAGCSIDGPGSCATVNFWTHLPASVGEKSPALAAARGVRVDVETDDGRLRIHAAHIPAPSPLFWRPGLTTPAGHRIILEALMAELSEGDRSLLVGDLNLSDRQTAYREITDHWQDLTRISATGPTSRRGLLAPLLLRIDHVLASPDLCASTSERFTVPGSDHAGLAVVVGPC